MCGTSHLTPDVNSSSLPLSLTIFRLHFSAIPRSDQMTDSSIVLPPSKTLTHLMWPGERRARVGQITWHMANRRLIFIDFESDATTFNPLFGWTYGRIEWKNKL